MKIVIGGPPHSGKSVFLYKLIHALPVDMCSLIRACPDGEGNWSYSSQGGFALFDEGAAVRRKHGFTQKFIDEVCKYINNHDDPIVIVDIGGMITPQNAQILHECDAAILVCSESTPSQEKQNWLDFFDNQVVNGVCANKPDLKTIGIFDSSMDMQKVEGIFGPDGTIVTSNDQRFEQLIKEDTTLVSGLLVGLDRKTAQSESKVVTNLAKFIEDTVELINRQEYINEELRLRMKEQKKNGVQLSQAEIIAQIEHDIDVNLFVDGFNSSTNKQEYLNAEFLRRMKRQEENAEQISPDEILEQMKVELENGSRFVSLREQMQVKRSLYKLSSKVWWAKKGIRYSLIIDEDYIANVLKEINGKDTNSQDNGEAPIYSQKDLLKILEYIHQNVKDENIAINLRANYISSAIARLLMEDGRNVSILDSMLQKTIPVKKLKIAKREPKENEEIKFHVTTTSKGTILSIEKLVEYNDPKSIENIELPPIPAGQDIYISGKVPFWFLASIVSSYDNNRIFTYQVNKGVTCVYSQRKKDYGKFIASKDLVFDRAVIDDSTIVIANNKDIENVEKKDYLDSSINECVMCVVPDDLKFKLDYESGAIDIVDKNTEQSARFMEGTINDFDGKNVNNVQLEYNQVISAENLHNKTCDLHEKKLKTDGPTQLDTSSNNMQVPQGITIATIDYIIRDPQKEKDRIKKIEDTYSIEHRITLRAIENALARFLEIKNEIFHREPKKQKKDEIVSQGPISRTQVEFNSPGIAFLVDGKPVELETYVVEVVPEDPLIDEEEEKRLGITPEQIALAEQFEDAPERPNKGSRERKAKNPKNSDNKNNRSSGNKKNSR